MTVTNINKNIRTPEDTLDFTDEEIANMGKVMVIGWSDSGHLFMRSSNMPIAEAIYLVEKVKNYILQAEVVI